MNAIYRCHKFFNKLYALIATKTLRIKTYITLRLQPLTQNSFQRHKFTQLWQLGSLELVSCAKILSSNLCLKQALSKVGSKLGIIFFNIRCNLIVSFEMFEAL